MWKALASSQLGQKSSVCHGPVKQGGAVDLRKGTEKPRCLYRDPGKAASGVATKSARPLELGNAVIQICFKGFAG